MGTREEFLFNYFFFFFDEKQQGNILNKDLKSTKEGWEILPQQRNKQLEPPK